MRVLQILLLTIGLVLGGTILSRVSAQNTSNSNTAANRYSANYGVNDFASNSYSSGNTANVSANAKQSLVEEDYPIVLKQISMQRVISFPQNGSLIVQVVEEIGKPFSLKFVSEETEKVVANLVLKDPYNIYIREYFYSAVDPKVRFRMIEMEGLPSPLIHLVMVKPGGSDYGFWSILIGEINGKIQVLTPQTIRFSWEGGVQIGELGKGNGTGVAIWNSIWGDGEAHYAEHHYQVEFYNFNKKNGKFVKTKKVVTKQKHETPAKALESLGLGFYKDAVRDFPEFLEYRENF